MKNLNFLGCEGDSLGVYFDRIVLDIYLKTVKSQYLAATSLLLNRLGSSKDGFDSCYNLSR